MAVCEGGGGGGVTYSARLKQQSDIFLRFDDNFPRGAKCQHRCECNLTIQEEDKPKIPKEKLQIMGEGQRRMRESESEREKAAADTVVRSAFAVRLLPHDKSSKLIV